MVRNRIIADWKFTDLEIHFNSIMQSIDEGYITMKTPVAVKYEAEEKLKPKKPLYKIAEDKRGSAMARAIISVSETLGLITIGEGVETFDQVERLWGMGCGLGQGYFYSTALSEHELIGYLRRLNQSPDAVSNVGVRPSESISIFSQLQNC